MTNETIMKDMVCAKCGADLEEYSVGKYKRVRCSKDPQHCAGWIARGLYKSKHAPRRRTIKARPPEGRTVAQSMADLFG